MRHLTILICALFCALACAGESYETDDLDIDGLREQAAQDAEEFEELEQPFLVEDTYGFRSDLSSSNTRCLGSNTAVATQVCNVPKDKTPSYFVTGTGMSAAQKTDAQQKIDGFIASFAGQFPTWTMSRITSNADINISYGALNSGNPKTSIHRYVKLTTVAADNLGAPAFGGIGTWRKYKPSSVCTIDRPRIIADFSTTTQQTNVLRHALGTCFSFGLGLGTGGGVTRPNAIAVTENAVKSVNFSEYAKCLVNKFDPTVPEFFSIIFNCVGLTDN
jgi:hypothetical protein